ncbi:MAG TPA: FHA domain-containing protein [Phycisphaerae bacterium]|nr:FHA domain-containing protein [Phycisphaerae bacterium]
MFSRWLNVRVRAAERALEEGRLDEAFRLAVEPEVRGDARAGRLLQGLSRRLLARARLAREGGWYERALGDLDRLRVIGLSSAEAEELRAQVIREMDRKHQAAAQRRAAVEHDAAQRRAAVEKAAADLKAGRLESGRLAVECVTDERGREELREQLDVRLQRSGQLLRQAGEALERGETLIALRFWQEARDRHGRTAESDEFAVRLSGALRRACDEWIAGGRLEPLLAAAGGLAALRAVEPGSDELERLAGLCGRAAGQLGSRDYQGLRETLLRLRAARQGVGWIEETLAALTKIAQGQEALLSSPLGLLASMRVEKSEPEAPAMARAAGRTDPTAALNRLETDLTDTGALLMLVDGAGSFLVLPHDCVRIGRAGRDASVDVPIPADVQSHHADITRDGEDYFLTAYGPVQVNQRDVRRTLLRNGDRIVLGPKAKMVFHKPSAKSDSAVLRLSHRCRLAQDVSGVVLFHQTCLIGPQSSCHVRTAEGQTQVVLFERGGRLYGREAASGGGKLGDPRELAAGATYDFGEVRIALKRYDGGRSYGRRGDFA